MEMSGLKCRRSIAITVFLFLVLGLSAQDKMTREQYIEKYAKISMQEMAHSGIPASITLAQGCLESNNGNSRLAVDGKNHFGIKCHDWTGKKIYHDDDEKDECFRKYKSVEESFFDHSEFLLTKSRYEDLFSLKEDDYKAWAKGLKKAGYATSNKYADLLIKIIEENELFAYDEMVLDGKLKFDGGKEHIEPIRDSEIAVGREVLLNNRVEYIIAQAGDNSRNLRNEMQLYPREIFRYNDIAKDFSLEPGMRIYLQPKRYKAEKGIEQHELIENETLWDISQFYAVRLKRLYRMNNISVGTNPEAGTFIQLRRGIKPDKTREKSVKEGVPDEQPKMKMEFDEF